jgi:hypothetical protein
MFPESAKLAGGKVYNHGGKSKESFRPSRLSKTNEESLDLDLDTPGLPALNEAVCKLAGRLETLFPH